MAGMDRADMGSIPAVGRGAADGAVGRRYGKVER